MILDNIPGSKISDTKKSSGLDLILPPIPSKFVLYAKIPILESIFGTTSYFMVTVTYFDIVTS